jgi:hypothetical protein
MRGRSLIALATLCLVVVACGSDVGTADPGGDEPAVTDQTTLPETDSPSADDNRDGGAAGNSDRGTITRGGLDWPIVGIASVDIGDHNYDISLLDCRVDDNDMLFGSGYGGDETTGQYMQFFIQPQGTPEPGGALSHSIILADVGESLDWNAGSGPFLGPITSEHSMILDWTRNGMKATGSALFIETNYAYHQDENANYPEPKPVEGTFEVDCSS